MNSFDMFIIISSCLVWGFRMKSYDKETNIGKLATFSFLFVVIVRCFIVWYRA